MNIICPYCGHTMVWQSDFNYDVECGIGSVKIGNEEYGGVAFNKTIHNGQNREIEISCGIGEIQLSFEQ